MLRPITSKISGRSRLRIAGGPDIANINFPAAATGLAPKTGEAMNVAPLSPRLDEHSWHVCG